MNPVYPSEQLESKKLSELKAIALQLNAIATDKRSKQSWVDVILEAQRKTIKPLEEIKPAVTCTDCPKFQSHADGTDKGWCCLFDRFARDHHQMTQDCINTIEVEQDDYLFHDSMKSKQPEEKQPINLPRVGETYFIGDRLLRCIQVGGEYAAVWDVIDNGIPMGEISMGWDCFWTHNLSFATFATPQEATVDLIESAMLGLAQQELDVFPIINLNVFAVTNRKTKKRYEVSCPPYSCTCPHWVYCRTQPRFRDKHIDAVKNFLQSRPLGQLCYKLT